MGLEIQHYIHVLQNSQLLVFLYHFHIYVFHHLIYKYNLIISLWEMITF
jgi:hypothetical protein